MYSHTFLYNSHSTHFPLVLLKNLFLILAILNKGYLCREVNYAVGRQRNSTISKEKEYVISAGRKLALEYVLPSLRQSYKCTFAAKIGAMLH